jgi:hypothetical protein
MEKMDDFFMHEESLLDSFAVMREFPSEGCNQLFLGVFVAAVEVEDEDSGERLYSVLYSDMDREDLNKTEFNSGRKLYHYVKRHHDNGLSNIMLQWSELRKYVAVADQVADSIKR